jgi:hypothetical protein
MRKKPRGGRMSDDHRKRNATMAKRRAPAEGTFGMVKRVDGWLRSRWRGLLKTTRELRWTIMALNLGKLHPLGWLWGRLEQAAHAFERSVLLVFHRLSLRRDRRGFR